MAPRKFYFRPFTRRRTRNFKYRGIPFLTKLYFSLWFLSLPAFAVASSPLSDVNCRNKLKKKRDGTLIGCPAEIKEKVGEQQDTLWGILIIISVGVLLFAAYCGWRNARARFQFSYNNAFGNFLYLAISLPPFLFYALGYGAGRLITGRIGFTRVAKKSKSDWAKYQEAPDTAFAMSETVAQRTGNPIGAVLGWTADERISIITANPESAVLVLGPPRSGKTSAVIIPTVMMAPGACVSSSIKSDVMLATAHIRALKGNVWHFDPGLDEVTPAGVLQARWSPLVSVRTWDDALLVGATMAKSLSDSANSDHFLDRAAELLQVLLYSGSLGGRDIGDVVEWAVTIADIDAQVEVRVLLDAAAAEGDVGARIALRKFDALCSTPDREFGSIISSLSRILRVYDSVSAREVGTNPNFKPEEFVRSTDTLYITARPDKQEIYAPILAALLENIRFATYDRHRRQQARVEPARPQVTFALDEANNTAPIPLPSIVSEAGGQGLHLVVGLQALGSAAARWGPVTGSFLTLFPTKVIFRGNFDHDTVQALSDAAGEYDRETVSYSHSTTYVGERSIPVHQINPNYSTQRARLLSPSDITGLPEGRSLVWFGPQWSHALIDLHYLSGVWQAVSSQAAESLQARFAEEHCIQDTVPIG